MGLQGVRAGRSRPVGAEDAGSGPFHGGDNLLLRSLQDRGGCWRCVCGSSKGGCDLRGHCAIIAEPGQPAGLKECSDKLLLCWRSSRPGPHLRFLGQTITSSRPLCGSSTAQNNQ